MESVSISPPAPISPPSPIASTSTLLTIIDPPLTKTAAKRLAKKLAHDAGKQERRTKERNRKKEKNLEKRKLIDAGLLEREDPKKSKKAMRDGVKERFGSRVVIDLGFDDKMTDREIKSMTSQLSYCYSANRVTAQPVDLLFSSFNGKLKSRLDDIGTTHESWKGVEWWEEDYQELYSHLDPTLDDSATPLLPSSVLVKIGTEAGKPRAQTLKSNMIYLSADSPNILSAIDPTKTYIIGGIVDKNRYKALCFDKANEQGIQHAQLPIGQFLPLMQSRKVLTVNHVMEIMLEWILVKDWEKAFKKVMPMRKFKIDENNLPRKELDDEMEYNESIVYEAIEEDEEVELEGIEEGFIQSFANDSANPEEIEMDEDCETMMAELATPDEGS